MRVIAGRLGGRNFESPRGHRTHPMSDKIRGALFNALGNIEGLTVLDAFAGSGALSIEALSRGAASATAIDIDPGAIRTIKENAQALGLERNLKAIRSGATSWLGTSKQTEEYDIVLADPPYDDVQLHVVTEVAARTRSGGLLVVSLPPHVSFEAAGFELVLEKQYGDASLRFLRRQ